MRERDYYQMLGVTRNASNTQLRAAFARQAKRVHPDFNPSGSDRSRELSALHEAFRQLSQPDRRADYDRMLAAREVTHIAAQQRLRRRLRRYDVRLARRRSIRLNWRLLGLLAGVTLLGIFAAGH